MCTLGPIIGNLPQNSWLVAATVWCLNVCLVLTYPIQLIPVFQILEDAFLNAESSVTIFGRTISARKWFLGRAMGLRAIVVCVSVGVGVGIPFFDLFLSLIGGLGSAQLMFILPPLAYMATFWLGSSKWMRAANIALLVFGVATMLVTTTFTVISIVDRFESLGNNVTACNITGQ